MKFCKYLINLLNAGKGKIQKRTTKAKTTFSIGRGKKAERDRSTGETVKEETKRRRHRWLLCHRWYRWELFVLSSERKPSPHVLKHILEWLSTGRPILSARRTIVIRYVPEEQLVATLSRERGLDVLPALWRFSKKKTKKEKIEGGEKEARRKEHEVNPCECIHPRALHTWPSKDFHTYSVEENTRLRMYARGNKRAGGRKYR